MTNYTACNYDRSIYNTLTELFSDAILSGFLTTTGRKQLQETLLDDELIQDDLIIVNRLLYAIRHNLLKLSA